MERMDGQQAEGGTELNPKIFPTCLIILDVCAAAGYIGAGDWRKIVYWVAAACLTYVVTY
ncbi:MAG TPA: hypothetical protein VK465_07050 [Fibrobacteria bacterium]|nr:hypothetical protein [Fibrobacteria bacterium]